MNKQLPDLIARASAVAGSDSALARSLGVPQPMVSMWKLGKKTCPPEDQASMAAIAGLDPVQALVRAHLERHEGTAKGDRLMKVMGKSLLATGAAIGSVGASAHQIFSTVEGLGPLHQCLNYFIQCILLLNRKRIFDSEFQYTTNRRQGGFLMGARSYGPGTLLHYG